MKERREDKQVVLMFLLITVCMLLAVISQGRSGVPRKRRFSSPPVPEAALLVYSPRHFSALKRKHRELTDKIKALKEGPRSPMTAAELRRLHGERLEVIKKVLKCANVNLIQLGAAIGAYKVRSPIEQFAKWQLAVAQIEKGQKADLPLPDIWKAVSYEAWSSFLSEAETWRLWAARSSVRIVV